ncbi:uncharacterized protein B0I36DRAFT_328662 [Microdochium trichocladiopsis]|uniref:Uncharacterized protein n=1 Tax=Microdochium trichocladiopsis TaxID=1682393 RepID=A0A9P8Y2S7_9PEZI|nr:uncharacterized protein B0I36DRAFT_328662 [Microdochium trichocladiopsis]KAH7028140.1 hypothetical protein B0I36DRAFT_328662 [Microdochium trichocladiopsis]
MAGNDTTMSPAPASVTSTTSQFIPAPLRPSHIHHPTRSVFLAGSTSSSLPGPSSDWRASLASSLANYQVTIFDPARPDWDASWRESADFAPWKEQVQWELDMQEAAAAVVVWFARDTKAPVSLLELGLVARQRAAGDGEGARRSKAVVVCEEGFWKEGNVRMVCERFGVEVVDGVGELVGCLKERFGLV